jgi:hypothetical protein
MTNLTIVAFILILGLIAAIAAYLDHDAMQSMRTARSRSSSPDTSPKPKP